MTGSGKKLIYPVLVFAILAVGIASCTISYWRFSENKVVEEAYSLLEAVSELKVNQIGEWRKERMEDANCIYGNPLIRKRMEEVISNPSDDGNDVRAWMDEFCRTGRFSGALLVDPLLHVRVASVGTKASIGDYAMKMISSVADRGGPLLSDFHTSNNINDLHLDMYVPLFKEIGGEGRKCMGILFFRINLYFAVGISFSA